MWGSHEHPGYRDLVRLIDGEAAPADHERFEAHLRTCAACRDARASIASTLSAVDALYARDEAPAAAAAARARLADTLRDLRTDTVPTHRASAVTGRTGLADWLRMQRWNLAVAGLLVGVTLWTLTGGLADAPPRTAPQRHAASIHGMRDGALPRHSATPGAVSAHTAAELCAGVRPSRLVPDATRRLVLQTYGMADVHESRYELDALITPELGGTTDAGNLWPQLYESPVWNARVKDELERLLPELVCRGELDLAVAQREMATDWIAAYKHYFATDAPLRAHRGPARDDDDDLILLPASYASR